MASHISPDPGRGSASPTRQYEAGLLGRQLYEESVDPPGPEHIPGIVLYLATDEASGVNGQVFGASRGRVALYSRPTKLKGLYKDGVWTLKDLVQHFPSSLGQDMPKKVG